MLPEGLRHAVCEVLPLAGGHVRAPELGGVRPLVVVERSLSVGEGEAEAGDERDCLLGHLEHGVVSGADADDTVELAVAERDGERIEVADAVRGGVDLGEPAREDLGVGAKATDLNVEPLGVVEGEELVAERAGRGNARGEVGLGVADVGEEREDGIVGDGDGEVR